MLHYIRLFVCLLMLGGATAPAQDIHFSMFYASPLTLNPALTGTGDGSYRVAGIYRNQYRSISTPFQTYAGSFDIKLLQAKLKSDVFAVGGLFAGDRSGDGRLTMNSGTLNAAFHKGLDKEHRHYIGLGVQLGYTSKSLQWQRLSYPNQFSVDAANFDPTVSSGETVDKPTVGYFDMGVGLSHQSRIGEKVGVLTGVTLWHIVPPKQSFLGEQVKLSQRLSAHAGVRVQVTKNVYIYPNIIYQYQKKAQEINLGTSAEYHIAAGKSEAVLSLGAWYRVKDAAIITVGAEYYHTRLMVAYDINASSLKPATNNRGAFELALIFNGFIKKSRVEYPVLVPCPMM